MNSREKFSAVLVCMGLTLALLPNSGKKSFTVRPQKLLTEAVDVQSYFTTDQVAGFIVSEDSSVQIIDLRSPKEFKSFNIPGSRNIPYKEFLRSEPGSILGNEKLRNIFYSNGDFDSNFAVVFAKGMNFNNVYVMKGGLNEWFTSIMNSSFTGDRISVRENAIFETRTRAKKIFTEMNSLPDSLKTKFLNARHVAARKPNGGCE
jgi:rhodanese-related sulfurtransferase